MTTKLGLVVFVLAAAAAASAAPGCGGGSSSGSGGGSNTSGSGKTGGTGGSATTPEEACADNAAARCKQLSTCSKGYAIASRYGDMATCQTRIAASCMSALAAPGTGQSPANIESCSQALASESCDDFLNNNPVTACLPPHGTIVNGMPCGVDGQCKSGWCTTSATEVCGVCGDQPQVGAACTADTDCGYDQACAKGAMTSGTCKKVVESGGKCGPLTGPCAAGLSCVGAMPAMMVAGTCAPAVTTVGATCDGTSKTGPNCDMGYGLFCEKMACVQIATAATGQPCGVINGALTACAADGTCLNATMTTPGSCEAAAQDGKPCDTMAGPGCLALAKCIVTGTGTAGTCTVSDPSSCK